MRRKMQTIISTLVLLTLLAGQAALAQDAGQKDKKDKPAQAPVHTQPQGAFPAPSGNGTPGQITKWTSASTLGDSVISEDKFGKIGVGTTTPGSKLTVAGMIETTAGGVKYSDGTVQMTAAVSGLSAVAHDNTLTGNGTQVSPLSVVSTDPAKQPFTQVVAAGSSSSLDFHVPQGKRLVIEQVSGSGAIVSGAKFLTVALSVTALINGV